MSQQIIQIDAFTDRPFSGNPAAVCLMTGPASERWMQRVAAEMNLSETAFLYPIESGYHLRWFTPKKEVKLCGHATLASAQLLWEGHHVAPDRPIAFVTLSGILTARREGIWIELDFPVKSVIPAEPLPGLIEALNVTPQFVGRYDDRYLLALESETQVRAVAPNFDQLARLPLHAVAITAPSDDPSFDFVSRYFAPSAGVNEDPVTGSAHCALGPYWMSRRGKAEFVARQLSSRGGIVRVRVEGDHVILAGQAVTVYRGELTI